MNHQYARERSELEEDLQRFAATPIRRLITVLLVGDLDRKTMHAIQYAKTVRSEETVALHLERDPASSAALERGWTKLGLRDIPLRIVRGQTDPVTAVVGFVGTLPRDVEVNVIVPGPARLSSLDRLRAGRTGSKMTRALLPFPNARTTLVRDHVGPGHTIMVADHEGAKLRPAPRTDHRVVVLVDRVDRAVLQAVRYALSLGATKVRAVHAGLDPSRQDELIARWMSLQIPVSLDILECWDRNVARCLETRVVELMGDGTEVTVVMPRRDFSRLRHRVLHDRSSRKIARALGRYEHVDISVVPYFFASGGRPGSKTDPGGVE